MLDKLTKENFETYLGEVFELEYEGGNRVTITLFEVNTYGDREPGAWGVPENARPEPFSVVFRGPHEPPLNQGLANLTHDKMGELKHMFLVPVSEDKDGRYYEAVFN